MKKFFVLMALMLFLTAGFSNVLASETCEELNSKVDLLLKQNATMNKELLSSTSKVNEATETFKKNSVLIKETNDNQLTMGDYLVSMNKDLPVRTFVLTLVLFNSFWALILILILRGLVWPFVKKSVDGMRINGLQQKNELLKQENSELKSDLKEFIKQGRVR